MTDERQPEPQQAPPPKPKKEPRTPRGTLNLALLVYIVLNLVYGLPMLLIPGFLYGTIGGAEDDALAALETTRWAGGVLLALAVGTFLLMAVPRGQRTFVTTISLQASLTGAALLFGAATSEYDGVVDAWFAWLPSIVVPLEAAYLWFARFKARDLLNA